MSRDRELGRTRGLDECAIQCPLGRRGDHEIVDVAAANADQMVMVTDELLGQFISGMVVVARHLVDDFHLLQVGQVAVHRALREARAFLQQFGHAGWTSMLQE